MNEILNKTTEFSKSRLFEQYVRSNPVVLVDVGARGGIHSRWNVIGRNIRVVGFEPDAEECRKLNEKSEDNHIYFPFALYDRDGMVDINIMQNLACSSVYVPNSLLIQRFPIADDYKVTNRSRIECHRIDEILKLNNIQNVDFLKVDTQGSEMRILEGAKETLKSYVFGIDIELEFLPLYKQQPLFSDVDEYLREYGFVLFDLNLARLKRKEYTKVYSKGQVLWAHAVYFKDFLSDKNWGPDSYFCFEKAIKSIAIVELYGFPDFALELLDFYKNKRIIDPGIYKDIKDILIKDIPSTGYLMLKNIFSILKKYLRKIIPSLL